MGALVTAANILNGIVTGISMVNEAMEPLRPPPPDPTKVTETGIMVDTEAERKKAQADVDRIEQEHADASSRKKDALRRAVASRRARFGAQGGQAGGSGEAVLLGLIDDNLLERDKLARSASSRIESVNDRLAHAHRTNLLKQQRLRYQRALNNYNSQSGYFF